VISKNPATKIREMLHETKRKLFCPSNTILPIADNRQSPFLMKSDKNLTA
jgi:hypothetical protein